MIVLFIGDTHGNVFAVERAYDFAAEVEAEVIVQVGDFGWWPRHGIGRRFLRRASQLASETRIPLHWVDGNHEDHSELPRSYLLPGTEWVRAGAGAGDGAGADAGCFHRDYPGLIWHPRGTMSQLGDSSVLWFGGAVSIDRHFRREGETWFWNEVWQDSDLARARRSIEQYGRPDVMVAHDAPFEVPLEGADLEAFGTSPAVQDLILRKRRELTDLVNEAQPDLYVHGHWHQYGYHPNLELESGVETTFVSLADDGARFEHFFYAAWL